MYWVYNLALTLTAPLWVPWMWLRSRKRTDPVDWKQRCGDYGFHLAKRVPRLWLHAVSVGEVVAARPILGALRERDPSLEIVLSVTTSSGHKTATETCDGLYDRLVYFPIDVPAFTLRAMAQVRPSVVAVMETELWFNFLWAAKTLEARTLLVNGRLSDRSFPRARQLRFFYAPLLAMVDECLAQTDRDAERLRSLGAQNVQVLGNSKFDEAVQGTEADPAKWRAELGVRPDAPVVVVGSTRSELEEQWVAAAVAGLGAQVVWAPRHIERAEAVCAAAGKAGLRAVRRSQGGSLQDADVLVLDTFGELAQVYSVADVVVVGGGFDRLGGQNILQPLAHAKPVVHGPNMQNFRDVAEAAAAVGATMVAQTSAELQEALAGRLTDPKRRQTMGQAAQALIKASTGAAERYAEAILAAAKS